MLFEENIEYFTYLSFNNTRVLFSLNFSTKIYHALWLIFFFFLCMYPFAFYFLVKHFYEKKSKNFIDFSKFELLSFILISIRLPIRDFLSGMLHSVLHYDYFYLITCLSLVDAMVAISLLLEWKYKVFSKKLFGYLVVIFHLTFAMFSWALWFDFSLRLSHPELESILETIINILLIIQISLVVVIIIVRIVPEF